MDSSCLQKLWVQFFILPFWSSMKTRPLLTYVYCPSSPPQPKRCLSPPLVFMNSPILFIWITVLTVLTSNLLTHYLSETQEWVPRGSDQSKSMGWRNRSSPELTMYVRIYSTQSFLVSKTTRDAAKEEEGQELLRVSTEWQLTAGKETKPIQKAQLPRTAHFKVWLYSRIHYAMRKGLSSLSSSFSRSSHQLSTHLTVRQTML